MTVKLLVLSLLVVRGIFEIRASVGALVGVVIVWIAYSSAVVLQIPAVKENLVQDSQFYYGNCLLIGSCSVFMSIVQYARFVFLHSNGLLESEVPQNGQAKETSRGKGSQKEEPPKVSRSARPDVTCSRSGSQKRTGAAVTGRVVQSTRFSSSQKAKQEFPVEDAVGFENQE